MFSRTLSHKYTHLSTSAHELPRWRTPSPMATSNIPPPIVQSTYAAPDPRTTAARTVPVYEPTTPSFDKQRELESDLQFLLDAQADGLSGGLGSGGLPDDHTSTGSTTPTAQSVRSASTRQASRPRARRIPGIRSARKGIYTSIVALSDVKTEEIEDIDEDIREKERNLERIGEWEQKKERLQAASKSVEGNADTVRSQRLRHEADVLQQEIHRVELQLADMKGRQRKLLKEMAAAENAVQAKLASYNSSLRLLEEDVQKFLSLHPSEGTARPTSRDGSVSVWQLPPKRRTLELAKQYWNEERDGVLQQRESIQNEKAALDEGAVFWKDIVVQLTEFERLLRTNMAERAAADQKASEAGDSSQPSEHHPRCSAEVLGRMGQLIQDLEGKFETATARSWNPLIAAIGAELDALKQGRQLLGGNSSTEDDDDPRSDISDSGGTLHGSVDSIRKVDQGSSIVEGRMNNGTSPEDDPDPELLFSKHEIDSE